MIDNAYDFCNTMSQGKQGQRQRYFLLNCLADEK